MMRHLFIASFCLVGIVRGQSAAPAEVAASAVTAVEALGKEVVKGHYSVAIDRMYPQWKERMATRSGGMEKLQAKLESVGKAMAQQGVVLLSFTPTGSPKSYEVWPGKGKGIENGKEVETLIYEKWMVLIPTKTVYRIVQPAKDGQPAQTYNITSEGFQVAVSDKGKNDWTFIDGAGLSVTDLRSIFITLPEKLELPEIKRSADPK